MPSFRHAVLAGLALATLAGAAEAMPIAAPSGAGAPVAKAAVVVVKRVVRRPMRPMVRRRVIIKKIIR